MACMHGLKGEIGQKAPWNHYKKIMQLQLEVDEVYMLYSLVQYILRITQTCHGKLCSVYITTIALLFV